MCAVPQRSLPLVEQVSATAAQKVMMASSSNHTQHEHLTSHRFVQADSLLQYGHRAHGHCLPQSTTMMRWVDVRGAKRWTPVYLKVS